jgi:hypothetical protein
MESNHQTQRRRSLNERKKKKRAQNLMSARPQLDVQGVPYACSPPVCLNLVDKAAIAKKGCMTEKDWFVLGKTKDRTRTRGPKIRTDGHVCPPAQAGSANATPDHMSASEVVVATAIPTTRGARLLTLAQKAVQKELEAGPSKEPHQQPQPAGRPPRARIRHHRGMFAGGRLLEKFAQDVIRLRKDSKPSLEDTAGQFTVPYVSYTIFTDVKSLKIGGYGETYTAKWHDKDVVIKIFSGPDGEMNASREAGQVQLGRNSWAVVALLAVTCREVNGQQKPCLVYKYAGNTLWSVLSDPASHPLVSPIGLCYELSCAVNSLHTESGMLHCDLKGNNVMLRIMPEPGVYKVRLIDLGTSQPIRANKNTYLPQGALGLAKTSNKHWFGPEYATETSFKSSTDTWSLGFLLLDCLLPLEGGRFHTTVPSPGAIANKFGAEVEEQVLKCFLATPRWRPSLPTLIALFKDKK